jgi:DNA-binding CsgD family transcriptional regulator
MENQLRKTGIFFASIFVAGSVFVVVIELAVSRWSIAQTLASPSVYLTFAVALLFYLSAVRTRLAWIQPVIFLAIAPYSISTDSTSFFGLGLYAIALILLYRLGFYDSRRVLKIFLSFGYFALAEAASVIVRGSNLTYALGAIFFMTVFVVSVYLVFQEKLAVYLKEPKRELSLKEKGLATTERAYTLAFASGRSTKEVAFDFGVSESTVRNTLARSYKKLGVEDKAGLSALAERYRLVD